MWRSIIDELEDEDAVGQAIPVVCHRHPDSIKNVSEPGQLPNFAPDGKQNSSEHFVNTLNLYQGGCLRACDTRLTCGHLCPYKVRDHPI